MMMRISRLHQQVSEQKQELDEMTQILFKQNTQLSSLYHIELELMGATELDELCAILVTSLVNDLDVSKAVIFLINEHDKTMTFSAESGLPGLSELDIPVEGDTALHQSLHSARIVSSSGYSGSFELGDYVFKDWLILGLKGRDSTQGMLVAELEDDDLTDPISILTNYSGILLENLRMQQTFKQADN